MTKKIQVSRPVCSATAAGRVFGPLKAPKKQSLTEFSRVHIDEVKTEFFSAMLQVLECAITVLCIVQVTPRIVINEAST